MPYMIKQTSTGKWVARSGARHSYTDDITEAAQFATSQDAQREACLEGESIWFTFRLPRGPVHLDMSRGRARIH